MHGIESSKLERKFQAALLDSHINDSKVPAMSAIGENLTKAAQIADRWKGYCENLYMMKKGKELNKNIGSKSLHHFVQRLLVPAVRQQVAKPQVLMRSQQNCSMQEQRQYWTEGTEYVW